MKTLQCMMPVLTCVMLSTVLTNPMEFKGQKADWSTFKTAKPGIENSVSAVIQRDALALTLEPPSVKNVYNPSSIEDLGSGNLREKNQEFSSHGKDSSDRQLTPPYRRAVVNFSATKKMGPDALGAPKDRYSTNIAQDKRIVFTNQYHQISPEDISLCQKRVQNLLGESPGHSVGIHRPAQHHICGHEITREDGYDFLLEQPNTFRSSVSISPERKKQKLGPKHSNVIYQNPRDPYQNDDFHKDDKYKDKEIISKNWEIARLPMPMIWHLSPFLSEGYDALKDNPISKDIDSWFSKFELFMLGKHRKCGYVGLDTKDIKETLEFCKSIDTSCGSGTEIHDRWDRAADSKLSTTKQKASGGNDSIDSGLAQVEWLRSTKGPLTNARHQIMNAVAFSLNPLPNFPSNHNSPRNQPYFAGFKIRARREETQK
ncbi:uncharacterized protein MELLADRAFT_113870 [Melampsora larici-populina 98AG31]|uniref:Secreted protein n=1 Tax=Melampsora larici-populina (strain 98AG31 / pathotype 3-4-7) TaxID=747676 RepID=F4SBA7_MELLP|nr:uncharacterized protein MELLADRAFT_113870 [Melampsora larici-populina 98AG31]EGF98060.1 hypothetical protein MELLADRAFT_113870 [Melampsora larici-populina 98AG31]